MSLLLSRHLQNIYNNNNNSVVFPFNGQVSASEDGNRACFHREGEMEEERERELDVS